MDAIPIIQKVLAYQFKDPALCSEALLLAGHGPPFSRNNDGNASLALIGEGVLRLGIGLQSREKKESKGDASRRVDRLANVSFLSHVFDRTGLFKFVDKNPDQVEKGKISPKVRATTIKALLGAVYLDGDLKSALNAMHRLEIE